MVSIIESQIQQDKEIIDYALRKVHYENFSFFEEKEIYDPHVVLAGGGLRKDLNAYFVARMKIYEIESMVKTRMAMSRINFITKQDAKARHFGNFSSHNYYFGGYEEKESVNDDLESLYEKFRLGKGPMESTQVSTYFMSKLTENEMELFRSARWIS